MNKLVSYVSSIHGLSGPVTIVRQDVSTETWREQDIEVHKQEITFVFDNGAVIRRSIEWDQVSSDALCAECWIDYEVIQHPTGLSIDPPSQRFDNVCRETFWLRYHTA
ncbi:conserved hypothetical protein [Burkholderia sp. H160]|nr:conserved hypothetical protein [Burkholderia sp. H160]